MWTQHDLSQLTRAPKVATNQPMLFGTNNESSILWDGSDMRCDPGTGALYINKDDIQTTSTDGLVIENATAALVGTTVQYSPRIRRRAHAWDADDGVSRSVDIWDEVVPTNGNTVYGKWQMRYSLDGAASEGVAHVETGGNLTTALGYYALYGNSGANSTGAGAYCLASSSGAGSTGAGYACLQFNSGEQSTGAGYFCLASSSGANSNATGSYSGYYNAGANLSTSGYESGYFNCVDDVSAVGYQALYKNDGTQNSALGSGAFTAFNEDAGSAKNFAFGDIDIANERVTIVGHGFGAIGTYRILKFTEGTAAVPGLTDGEHYQVKIIDNNTLEFEGGVNITAQGAGNNHTLTPRYVYTNSTAIGYNAEPDASNQVMLGDTNVTQIKTTGKLTMTGSIDSAAVADEVSLGRYEIGAGNTVLAISQETAVAAEVDETKFSHKMQLRINGGTYYMMLTTT